jgi:hypothetical protein
LKLDGYKPTPLSDSQPKPKKRIRAQKLLMDSGNESDISYGAGIPDGD